MLRIIFQSLRAVKKKPDTILNDIAKVTCQPFLRGYRVYDLAYFFVLADLGTGRGGISCP